MTKRDIEQLFAFNDWANARTFAAAAALSPEQFGRDLKSSYPSVHATLLHMLAAEWAWLERWLGRSPKAWPDQSGLGTLAEVRAGFADVQRGQHGVLATLTDARIAQPLAYTSIAGQGYTDSLGATMQHVVNHASYHRGQVTTMIRQLGATAQATDFITFVREHPAR